MNSSMETNSLESKLRIEELTVLEGELKSLRKLAKVYKQQPNSQIFFLEDKSLIQNEVQKNLQNLKNQVADQGDKKSSV